MNLHVPRTGVVGLVAMLALAAVLFVYLMGRFGGPSIDFSSPYEVSGAFRDAQGLSTKSDVLVRGVKVGEVRDIRVQGGLSTVRLTIERRYAPIHRDATARIGQKTLLGESYVDLRPGSPSVAALPSGATLPHSHARGSVELDEALGALDERVRPALRSMLGTFGRGARSPFTADRMNRTLSGLRALTGQLRELTRTLHGQEATIAAMVSDSRTVFGTLAGREEHLSSLVSAGRATLSALASRQRALGAGLVELPKLLASAQRTLADARPLLVEARPLVGDLRATAPALTPALQDLRPVSADARRVLAGLPALVAAALPTLDLAQRVIDRARPVARLLAPALANLVPVVRYLGPRKNTFAAWFTNTASLGLHGDQKGSWARFFIFMEPGTAFGTPGVFSNNAYTGPDDAAHNEPYRPGGYPRLQPFTP